MLAWTYYHITTNMLSLWPSKSPPPVKIDDIIVYIWHSEGDAPLWFLSTLFQFALIAPIIGWVMKKSRYSIFLAIVCGFITHELPYTHVLFWLPCLLLATWCALWLPFISPKIVQLRSFIPHGLAAMIGIALISMFCILFWNVSDRSHNNLYYLYRMLAPLFLGLVFMDYNCIPIKWAKQLSAFTVYAYGTHFIIIELLKVAVRFSPVNSFIIQYLFIIVFTCVIIYLSGTLLKKIHIVWYWLNGCRSK